MAYWLLKISYLKKFLKSHKSEKHPAYIDSFKQVILKPKQPSSLFKIDAGLIYYILEFHFYFIFKVLKWFILHI